MSNYNQKSEAARKTGIVCEQTKEMERCYLGSLLLPPQERTATRLTVDDFYHKDHKKVFETIYKLWDKNIIPDITTVHNELKGDVQPADIAELTNKIPSAANISYYENEVYEASKTRLLAKISALFNERMADPSLTGADKETAIQNLINALAGVTSARNEAGIKTATELLNTEFPEIRWIVPGLIGEGLTLICGAPKIGKSWLVLNLAIAAAAGGGFLGTLTAKKTDTLYISLEDRDQRIHNRLKKLKAPEADNLKITTQWRDGYTGLEYYLKSNNGIGLVIIDTLARFANIEDMNDYSATTNAMARLKRIADEMNIAIILIHHAKKKGQQSSGSDWMESALGSTGLTGATDSTIFIARDRPKNTAELYATGRDAADIKYSLKLDLDCGGWTISSKTSSGQGSGEKDGDNIWDELMSNGAKNGNR